jgi:hypothetical protein
MALATIALLTSGGALIGFLLSVLGAGGSILLLLPLLVSAVALPTKPAVSLSLEERNGRPKGIASLEGCRQQLPVDAACLPQQNGSPLIRTSSRQSPVSRPLLHPPA